MQEQTPDSSRVSLLLSQLENARNYNATLLNAIPQDHWFEMPCGVTHIAWQVGHLAMAEYHLAIQWIWGPQEDAQILVPNSFERLFRKGSIPLPDSSIYPTPTEILDAFNHVHQCVLKQTAQVTKAMLNEPSLQSHPQVKTKLDALIWCICHEMLHAGQIALLRREIGFASMR